MTIGTLRKITGSLVILTTPFYPIVLILVAGGIIPISAPTIFVGALMPTFLISMIVAYTVQLLTLNLALAPSLILSTLVFRICLIGIYIFAAKQTREGNEKTGKIILWSLLVSEIIPLTISLVFCLYLIRLALNSL